MSTATATLYETDFYGWIKQQVAMLRGRNVDNLDFENLIEEVESMGRSEKRELESRLELLLMHLLKWQYQPQRRSSSWEATILEQRRKVVRHLRENPSLRGALPETYEEAYGDARLAAASETKLPRATFPTDCPWTFEQAVADNFWPEAPATETVVDSR